jgi:hypothetical protein
MVSKAVMALSNQAITGWFTLAAGLGGAALVGFFGWLGRKGDRESAERQRQVEVEARREQRRAADMAQWRDSAADVLGRVREFMTDVHPQRVTFNYRPGTEQEIMQALNAKWEALREPTARLAIGHPSARARELADEVVSGLHRTLNWVGWALSELAGHRSFTQFLDEAMKEWEQLNTNVMELREALHEGS